MDEEKREWHVGVVLGGKRDLKAAAKKIRAHIRVRFNATDSQGWALGRLWLSSGKRGLAAVRIRIRDSRRIPWPANRG